MPRKKRRSSYVRNYAPGAASAGTKVMLTEGMRQACRLTWHAPSTGHEWNFAAARQGRVAFIWCGATLGKDERRPCLPERASPPRGMRA